MIAHFKVGFDDVLAIQKNAIKTTKTHQKRRYLASIVGVLILYILSELDVVKSISSVIWLFLLFIFIPYFIYSPLTFLKLKSDLKNNRSVYDFLMGDCKLTIDNKGLTKEYDNTYNTKEYIEWSQINRISNDDKRFFLYKNDVSLVMIKKYPTNMNNTETLKYHNLIKEHWINKERANK